ncbi:MAG: hypothetical protein J6X18_09565 [Bacteroidales bacterium]|nr:hypothetical protein [Bacteroidales bacterium]
MTQEEKQFLLKDICGRLPYKVKINCFDVPRTLESISIDCDEFVTIDCGGEHFYHPLSNILHKDCLPYLRPMSSMTDEERVEYNIIKCSICPDEPDDYAGFVDWLNEHHFDYRGLIEKGLAIEAPEGMYN